eukprot:COSAG02_NODE_65322_length_258_cov_0.654088_1_plen_37_part_01
MAGPHVQRPQGWWRFEREAAFSRFGLCNCYMMHWDSC